MGERKSIPLAEYLRPQHEKEDAEMAAYRARDILGRIAARELGYVSPRSFRIYCDNKLVVDLLDAEKEIKRLRAALAERGA